MPTPSGQPSHRRGAAVDAVVLTTVCDLLGDRGYGFSIDDVAQQADVHKTTIYRKWATKPMLIAAAMDHLAQRTVDLDHSDDPIADLYELTRRVAAALRTEAGGNTLRAVIAAAADDPELATVTQRFLARRYDTAIAIISAGQHTGRLRDDLDPHIVWTCIANPLHMHTILGDPADDAAAVTIVDHVLAGALATAP